MTRLIGNADDFGLTPGVNRAVAELAAANALTSATLMANGFAFAEAVKTAIRNSRPSVGCHVVLVDGRPILPAAAISSLVRRDGHLRLSLGSLIADLLRGRISSADVQREATAQILHLQSTGLAVDHIDTHKHTHMFPGVLLPLLRAAAACEVRAIRNPFEPAWSASAASHSLLRRGQVDLLRMSYARRFQKLCNEAGMVTTDGAIGVAATGSLTAGSLRALLKRLPSGVFELVCHPGANDADLAAVPTKLRASRPLESEALLEVIPEMVQAGRLTLTTFAQLAKEAHLKEHSPLAS